MVLGRVAKPTGAGEAGLIGAEASAAKGEHLVFQSTIIGITLRG